MMRYSYLCFLVLIVSVSAEIIDFNKETDKALIKDNQWVRKFNIQSFNISPGKVNNNVIYSRGVVLGFDSLQRTGKCTKTSLTNSTIVYDFHFGFKLLVAAFDKVILNGTEMCGYFRPRDNSVHMQVTVDNEGECKTSVDLFQLTRLKEVEFGSSRAEEDGSEVEDLFQNGVLALVNRFLSNYRQRIAQTVQVYVCGYADGPNYWWESSSR